MLRVYYIQHSCFLVELDDRYLLFDYFDREVVADVVSLRGSMPVLDDNKMLYVFASHSHKDHFSIEVLRWANERNNVKYILSKTIRLGFNFINKNGLPSDIKSKIQFVTAANEYKVDDMTVETLRSTDDGVAFLINVAGINIYHAGDHHWWAFDGRGELYGEKSGTDYKRELKRVIRSKKIDIAFVVLDPRLGEDTYFLGMDYFVKNIEVDKIFPMHMWGEYQWIDRFKHRPDMLALADRIVDIDRENLVFDLI